MKDYKKLEYKFGNEENYKDKKSLISYLKNHNAIGACPGSFKDPFTGESLRVNTIFSDGVYEWKEDLPYLIENYNVVIDEKFLEHCKIK